MLILGRVLVDLSRIEFVYRIVSFLAVGAVLLSVSVVYGRRSRSRVPARTEEPLRPLPSSSR